MCGIAGLVGRRICEKDFQIIKNMNDIQKHRGPDDEGIIVETCFVFGHRRLAIIDIEHGRQPMQSEDGRYTIVFNGEIYNYIELKDELQKRGVIFQTHCDTEVLLKLMQTEGVSALKKLNGMFAFAIFDKKQNVFIAGRDPFGIKPFYYKILENGNLLFASEIKALLVHPEVKAQINHEALQEYLTFQFCLKDKTLFKDIYKLEPGCFMVSYINEGPPRIKRYWELDYEIDRHHTEEYFIDSIRTLLDDSIRLQLRSDVEVGTYLSGGIDSSAVAVIAANKYPSRLQCFHGKFEESPAYNEEEFALEVVKQIDCIFHTVVPACNDFVALLPKLIYHMDEPAAGPGLFPQYIVSKLASQNVKVLLAGTGGDEIFGGYVRYFVAYLEQCLKGAIFETQEEGRHIVHIDSIIHNLNILKRYVPMLKCFWSQGLFEDMDRRYFQLINRSPDLKLFLNEQIYSGWSEDRMFAEFQDIFHNPNTKSYFNKMTHFDQKTLLPALLHVEDRVSMACSLESRVPLLDTRLVDLVTKMAPKMKFQEGKTKYIFKKAISDILPKKVLTRKDKMGFPVPLLEWSRGPAKDFIQDVLLSRESRSRGLFKVDVLEGIISNEGQFSRQLWGMLCLELWFKNFKVSL